MNVKRYFAKDMQEAMTKIRKELGGDAVILNNKPVRKKGLGGLFSKPMMEVVVAYDPKADAKPKLAIPTAQRGDKILTYGPPRAREPLNPEDKLTLPADFAKTLGAIVGDESLLNKLPQKRPAEAPLAAAIEENELTAKEPPKEPTPKTKAEAEPEKVEIEDKQAHAPEQSLPASVLDAHMNELSVMLSSFTGKLKRFNMSDAETYIPEVQELYDRLIGHDIEKHLAAALAKETQEIVEKIQAEPKEVMEQLMRQYIGDPMPIKPKRFKRSVVILLGTTGVGKTTTLVKLAAHFAIKEGLKVGVINADTYRIAAQEQLKTYSEILDMPMKVIYTPRDVTSALEGMEDRDLVFIDTAGKRPSDQTHLKEVKELIELSGADDVFLVISATTSLSAMQSIIENFEFIKNYKTMITKMDESPSAGILLNACYYSGKPISYLTTGQSVPDDIELAEVGRIVERILG